MFFHLHGDEISDSNKKQVKSHTLYVSGEEKKPVQ
jgi:hypothetical protein